MDAKVAPPYPAHGKGHLEVVPGEQSAPVVGEEPVLGGALGDGGLGSGATTILAPSLVDKASPSDTKDELADLKLHLMDVADNNVKPGVIRAGRRRREGTVVQHQPRPPPVDSVTEARTVLHLAHRRPSDSLDEATEAVRPDTGVVDEYERVSLDPVTGQTFCSAYMHGYALTPDLMDRFDTENVETMKTRSTMRIWSVGPPVGPRGEFFFRLGPPRRPKHLLRTPPLSIPAPRRSGLVTRAAGARRRPLPPPEKSHYGIGALGPWMCW